MKKKFITLLTFLMVIISAIIGTGCSFNSCLNCVDEKTKEAVACTAESAGDVSDCLTFSCVIMDESCHDNCYVAPCYYFAGCVRTCNPSDCGMGSLIIENLEYIDPEDYDVEIHTEKKRIDNLYDFYKLEVTVTVTTYKDIKDFVVNLDISDSLGNTLSDVNLFIDSEIKATSFRHPNSKSATLTATFSRDDDKKAMISASNVIKVSVNKAYGKY